MIQSKHSTAVVVLSYNGKALHELFFPELIKEADGNYDVVLIDNASTDDTLTYVQENFPTVQCIRLNVNRGFANGYYEGLQQIKAKYYVLLSADFEITPGWFSPLHSLMELNPDIGACQPKIKYYKNKSQFEYAGAGGGFMDAYGYLFCRGRIFFTIEEDEGQYNNTIETTWAGGGCMFVQAELYHTLGGLDAELYAHMEEVDLCWRIRNAGYRIAYCGQSTVYHIGGSVISYGSPQKIFYNYRNSLILLLKNSPANRILWLLPYRLLLDGVSGARSIARGDWKEVKAIFKAHWSFFLRLGYWLKQRKKVQAMISAHPNTAAVYNGSIVLDYFLRKKKRYTDLGIRDRVIENPAIR